MSKMSRLFALVATMVAIGSLLIAGGARADTLDTAGGLLPTISSDRPDYSPGETVTLNGSNWQPGEVVHISVNDSAGATWNRDVDVTADMLGDVQDSFALPAWVVAEYSVTATGALSGTATTTFTDGVLTVKSASAAYTFTFFHSQ